MNITGTQLTVSAVEKVEQVEFHIEFLVRDNKLHRAQFNTYLTNADPEFAGDYLGEVYYENGMISCNLPVSCDAGLIFGEAKKQLAKIEDYISKT